MSNQCHVSEFAKLDERGGYSRKKNYEDTNLTENFMGVKTGNDIYYMGEKHYWPYKVISYEWNMISVWLIYIWVNSGLSHCNIGHLRFSTL